MGDYDKAKKVSKRLDKKVSKSEKQLLKKSKRISKDLYPLYREYAASLQKDSNGNILNNAKNIAIVNSSRSVIYGYFQRKGYSLLNKLFSDTFKAINEENTKYYSYITDNESAERVSNIVQAQMSAIVGTSDLSGDGLLPQLLNPNEISRQIQNTMMKAVSSNFTTQKMNKELKNGIEGDQDRFGFVESYYYQNGYDSFAEYERASKEGYSKLLELNYAIYQGGEIKGTRSFCESRNGKVFNRETIESWQNLEWQGKKKGHNIIIDAGGYNCRHYYDWITFALARRLDPDIEKSKYD